MMRRSLAVALLLGVLLLAAAPRVSAQTESRVTVTGTATAIMVGAPGPLDGAGIYVSVKNAGATTVYLGGSGVTTSTGYALLAGEATILRVNTGQTIYGITSGASDVVHLLAGVTAVALAPAAGSGGGGGGGGAVTITDGGDVTLGSTTDAKSTATDGTSVTAMQVLKEISAMVQAPPSQAVTGPVTDTQLRATPVPVSGTVTTGGLTDTQLRATAVPISAASLPLPTGAATSAAQPALKTTNNAIPSSTNIGVLPSVANAAAPTLTETFQVADSVDLHGSKRTTILDATGVAQFTSGNPGYVNIANGGTTDTDDGTVAGAQASVALTLSLGQWWDGSNWKRALAGSARPAAGTLAMSVRPFVATDGTNDTPTMDAVGRPGFQKITDGTNTMPTMDAVGRPGFVKVTDGTNTQPTGDAVARPIYTRQTDGTLSGILDPCGANAKVYLPISQATSTQLIVGTSAKKLYVCSIFFNGSDAENVSVVAGTGSVCGTNTVAVIGGTTAAAGPNLAANSGFSVGNGVSSIAATTVNADNLCLLQSGSGRVAGVMTYVVQ